jgi:multiple sugar transport system permease protein
VSARIDRRQLLMTAISLVVVGVFLFPIYWMITTSIKAPDQITAYPPVLIPTKFDFSVWVDRIFSESIFVRYLLNSVIISLGTALLSVTLAAPAAYGLAHLKLRGKSALLLLNLAALMFPAIMIATPLFVIFSRLGINNTYYGLIIANSTLAMPFSTILLRPFFLSIPQELTEAARIDGCSRFSAFVRIVVPLARPGLFTAGVFSFLLGWGDLVFALTLIQGEELRPVTAGLWSFFGLNVTDWNGVMALSTLAMLPPLVVVLFAQRHIVAGLTAGGVKE